MKDIIVKLLAKAAALPVLFVGSGLTRRYLDMPNWEGLLRRYCIKSYEYYYDKAERLCRKNLDLLYPTIADFIEEDYNESWYTKDEFESYRVEYQEELMKKISPFKLSIAEYFRLSSGNIQAKYFDEISRLKNIGNKNISCIITTNYDLFMENIFGIDNFQPYIGQNELLFSTIYEIAEIYKIHGCCTKPDSLIINSYDYNQFINKNAYLSSKILTLFLERPIIFIGYSVSDPNIRRILQSISDCLENDQLDQLKERLIFIEWNNDPNTDDYISDKQFDFNNGKTITMKNISLNQYSVLYDAILENTVKYDVKALRRIKSQLYELVKLNKPTEKLYVATNIDESDDVDFVVGVGVYSKFGNVGYRGVKAEEIYLYVIGKTSSDYDDKMILKEAVPAIYSSGNTLPLYKIISKCDSSDCINEIVKKSLKYHMKDFLSYGEKEKIKSHGYYKIDSIMEYYSTHNLSQTLSKIPLIDPNDLNSDELLEFLQKVVEKESTILSIDGKKHPSRSQFKKCIRIWDWLKYFNDAYSKLKIK